MKNSLRWAIRLALFIAAFVAVGIGASTAGAQENTVDANAPVEVCGVQIAIGGNGSTDCGGAPAPTAQPAARANVEPSGSGDALVDDVDADAAAPVVVCGVGVSLLATTSNDCGGGSAGAPASAPAPDPAATPAATPAAGSTPTVAGVPVATAPIVDDVDADVAAPVAVCGVGVGLLGDSSSDCGGRAAPAASDEPSNEGSTTEPSDQVSTEPFDLRRITEPVALVNDVLGTVNDELVAEPVALVIGLVDGLLSAVRGETVTRIPTPAAAPIGSGSGAGIAGGLAAPAGAGFDAIRSRLGSGRSGSNLVGADHLAVTGTNTSIVALLSLLAMASGQLLRMVAQR